LEVNKWLQDEEHQLLEEEKIHLEEQEGEGKLLPSFAIFIYLFFYFFLMDRKHRRKFLEKQGYRLVGNHSGTKICLYCKNAIRGKDVCYKNTFYGIKSWLCLQASASIDVCNLKCQWCWRDITYTSESYSKIDEPKEIVEGLIEEPLGLLEGFKGNKEVDKKRLEESSKPKHVALSLTGETCLYPKLPELIDEFHKKGMTTFVVTNGTVPSMLKKLLEGHEPTQLYITLPAPDKETYEEKCLPLIKEGWERILESLSLLRRFKRGAVRLTLGKDINMFKVEKYAKLLEKVGFKFLELKAVMPIGDARFRVEYFQMPTNKEIKDFALEICKINGWKLIDEKKESRVVLIMRKDFPGRKLDF